MASRGVLSSIDMPLGDFVGSADLATRSLENASKRRAAWLKESHRLASDPSTLLYYGFEGHDSWARVLKDETNRGNGNGDGAVSVVTGLKAGGRVKVPCSFLRIMTEFV